MAASGRPSVVYVLPDKMGGATNIIANLLEHRRPDGLAYHAVLTRNDGERDAAFGGRLAADSQTTVGYRLPGENLHAVLRRLRAALPPGPGVIVANDLLDLALLSAHDVGRTSVQILHGDYDYYYDLAIRHQEVVDLFVGYSRVVAEQLAQKLPHRRESIFHLPYGVVIPDRARRATAGPLRLVYAGRLDEAKGILDLPAIDRLLRESGVDAIWTVIGAGPDEPRLRAAWPAAPHVRWAGHLPNTQVRHQFLDQDVFVLPSRAEGLPVAMLEAMAAGVAPVVTDLRSGVPEVVWPGVTGERIAAGDVDGFARAIAGLAGDRDRLEAYSHAARRLVAEQYDIRDRVAAYQALYARWQDLRRPRPRDVRLPYGSRLDRPWVPNALTKFVRGLVRQ
ncbi:MAG TPA: glycosyltransferase family 4 protein [Vicinamibacterales bacterium]|nr:glycosyltransferase family 4 protein [Vicinamibacterales bacterium]